MLASVTNVVCTVTKLIGSVKQFLPASYKTGLFLPPLFIGHWKKELSADMHALRSIRLKMERGMMV